MQHLRRRARSAGSDTAKETTLEMARRKSARGLTSLEQQRHDDPGDDISLAQTALVLTDLDDRGVGGAVNAVVDELLAAPREEGPEEEAIEYNLQPDRAAEPEPVLLQEACGATEHPDE